MRDRKISNRDYQRILHGMDVLASGVDLVLMWLESSKPKEHKILLLALDTMKEHGLKIMVQRKKKRAKNKVQENE